MTRTPSPPLPPKPDVQKPRGRALENMYRDPDKELKFNKRSKNVTLQESPIKPLRISEKNNMKTIRQNKVSFKIPKIDIQTDDAIGFPDRQSKRETNSRLENEKQNIGKTIQRKNTDFVYQETTPLRLTQPLTRQWQLRTEDNINAQNVTSQAIQRNQHGHRVKPQDCGKFLSFEEWRKQTCLSTNPVATTHLNKTSESKPTEKELKISWLQGRNSEQFSNPIRQSAYTKLKQTHGLNQTAVADSSKRFSKIGNTQNRRSVSFEDMPHLVALSHKSHLSNSPKLVHCTRFPPIKALASLRQNPWETPTDWLSRVQQVVFKNMEQSLESDVIIRWIFVVGLLPKYTEKLHAPLAWNIEELIRQCCRPDSDERDNARDESALACSITSFARAISLLELDTS